MSQKDKDNNIRNIFKNKNTTLKDAVQTTLESAAINLQSVGYVFGMQVFINGSIIGTMIIQDELRANELAAVLNKKYEELHVIGVAKVVPLQVF